MSLGCAVVGSIVASVGRPSFLRSSLKSKSEPVCSVASSNSRIEASSRVRYFSSAEACAGRLAVEQLLRHLGPLVEHHVARCLPISSSRFCGRSVVRQSPVPTEQMLHGRHLAADLFGACSAERVAHDLVQRVLRRG